MRLRALAAAATAALIGCATSSSQSEDGPAAPEDTSGASAPEGGAEGTGERVPAPRDDSDRRPAGAPDELTREECGELVAHVVDIALREEAKKKPDLPPPTDDAREALERELAAEFEPACAGRDRGVFECAMRASTREELEACERHRRPPSDGGALEGDTPAR